MSVVRLTRANLHRWREELARLVVNHDLIFVHATHHCVDPSWDFVASGQHPSLRIFKYHGVHTELAELMREEEDETIVGLCGLCAADTEFDFANRGEAPEAA